MLSKTQIEVANAVLLILEHEGASFSPSDTPSTGLSAREASHILVSIDAEDEWIIVEFREEAVCFSIQFGCSDLATCPTECIERAMLVRAALVNMSSN